MMYFRTTNFSTNLERIGVTDIGRRSVKLFTKETVGMGVTKACFHADGGLPMLNVIVVENASFDQISSLSRSCYILPHSSTTLRSSIPLRQNIAASIVHSKLDYCNSLYLTFLRLR